MATKRGYDSGEIMEEFALRREGSAKDANGSGFIEGGGDTD